MRNVCLFLQNKNLCFGIHQTLGKHFPPTAGCRNVFPAKRCQDAWRSGRWLARGQTNVMRQSFMAQFIQLPKLCDVWSGIAVEKNLVFSVDQCRLQLLQISVHLINLLSILLRCNGFLDSESYTGSEGSRSQNSGHDSWYKFGFGKWFGASSQSNHLLAMVGCHLKPDFHHTSQSDQETAHCCCIQ